LGLLEPVLPQRPRLNDDAAVEKQIVRGVDDLAFDRKRALHGVLEGDRDIGVACVRELAARSAEKDQPLESRSVKLLE
jgi:hypothetical protein